MDFLVALIVELVAKLFFLVVASLATAWALLKNFQPRQVVLFGAFVFGVLFLGYVVLSREDPKEPLLVTFQEYFTDQAFEKDWKEQSKLFNDFKPSEEQLASLKAKYRSSWYFVAPALGASECLAWGLVAYYLVSFILSRITPRVSKAVPFQDWTVPEPLVFGLILGAALAALPGSHFGLEILGKNLLVLFGSFYVLVGLSIVSSLFERWRLPRSLRLLSYFVLVRLLFDGVVLLGVLDMWFDFRGRKTPKTGSAA